MPASSCGDNSFDVFRKHILEIPNPEAKSRVESAIKAVEDVEELFKVIDKKFESIINEPYHKFRKYKNCPKAPAIRARCEWQSLQCEFHNIMRGATTMLVEQIEILGLVVETFGPELRNPNTSLDIKITHLRSINKVLLEHTMKEYHGLDELATKVKKFHQIYLSEQLILDDDDTKACMKQLAELESSVKVLKSDLPQVLGSAIGCDIAAGALFAIGLFICPAALPALIAIVPQAASESQKAATKLWEFMEASYNKNSVKNEIKLREKSAKEVQRMMKNSKDQFDKMVVCVCIISELWRYITGDISKIEGQLGKVKILSSAGANTNLVQKLQEEINTTLKLYEILLSILKAYQEGVNTIIPKRSEVEMAAFKK